MKQSFSFWTPGSPHASALGCASHGLAMGGQWLVPDAQGAATWAHAVPGRLLAGSYADIARSLHEAMEQRPRAAVVLFAHGSGMEAFLAETGSLFDGIPTAGGAAARGLGDSRGELALEATDVLVWLLDDGSWQADTLTVHEPPGEPLEFSCDGARRITRLRPLNGDWQPAADFYRQWQARFGITDGNCEELALADAAGAMIHCDLAGNCLGCGADLPSQENRLYLRHASREQIAQKLQDFVSVSNSLVFACAGLRGRLTAPLPPGAGTLVGFLFGELVTLGGRPRFGNLMASRLAPKSSGIGN